MSGLLSEDRLEERGGGESLIERRVLIEDLQYMLLIVFFFHYLHPQPFLTIFKVP